MSKKISNLEAIDAHRLLTEKRLARLLQDAESPVTIDQVRQVIFEGEGADSRTYLLVMLAEFNCPDLENADDALLQVIQDAWNYFPHRFFGGRCPAEVMLEESPDTPLEQISCPDGL